MSSFNYSIDAIAHRLAEDAYQTLKKPNRVDKSEFVEKVAYNFKQFAFNSATVGMIAMAVFSALSFSFWPLAPALGVGCWLLRYAVEKDLTESCGKVAEHLGKLLSSAPAHETKEGVLIALGGISLPNDWRPVAVKVAGITLIRSIIPLK